MADKRIARLGLWIFGDMYETNDQKNGHIEIANKVIEQNGWKGQFQVSKFNDPVDFLIFEKEAIKIGNQLGKNIITLADNTSGREVDNLLVIYEKMRWKIDYVHNPYRR